MNSLSNILLGIPLALAQSAADIPEKTTNQLENMVAFIFTQLPVWIAGFIVIALSFILAKVIQNSVENKLSQSGFEEEHKEMQVVIGRVVHMGVIILGITIGLKIGGLDLTPIIAAGAFGAGFAMQDMITNFLAGVMILSSKHFSIGDNIKVNGIVGKIVDIQTRATIVKNFDGTKVVIPNAELFKNPVTSYTSNPFRRVQVGVGVECGADLKKAMSACRKAAKETVNALIEPKPSVWLYQFGESSINLKVNLWIESKSNIVKTKTNLVMNINKELGDAGISIPYPVRTIIYDEDDRRRKEEAGKNKAVAPISEDEKIDMVVAQNDSAHANATIPTVSAPKGNISTEQFDAPTWLKKSAQAIVQPVPTSVPGETVAQPVVQPAATIPQPVANAPVEQPATFQQPAPAPSNWAPAPVVQTFQPAPQTYLPSPQEIQQVPLQAAPQSVQQVQFAEQPQQMLPAQPPMPNPPAPSTPA